LRLEKIDAYINGAAGDVTTLLKTSPEANYFFWYVHEMADFVTWARDYNLHREGGRPPLHVAGFDIYNMSGTSSDVAAYLDRVDPGAAASARSAYTCLSPRQTSAACRDAAIHVHDDLASRESTYGSTFDFAEAVQEAAIIVQYETDSSLSGRDREMADNAVWLKDHRSATHKIILWGHQDHIGKTHSQLQDIDTTGVRLAQLFGSGYFAIGTASGLGSFLGAVPPNGALRVFSLGTASEDYYETLLQSRGIPRLFVPLRGTLPDWLASPHHLPGGHDTGAFDVVENLHEKFDAVVYFDATTPNHTLP